MGKILVIDDEEQICDFLKTMLLHDGHDVMTAMDGVEGMDIFYNFLPDVVIVDIVMPKKNGSEVIAELLHGNQTTAIIAISGGKRENPELNLESNEFCGLKGFLLKPFSFDRLREVIQHSLSH